MPPKAIKFKYCKIVILLSELDVVMLLEMLTLRNDQEIYAEKLL